MRARVWLRVRKGREEEEEVEEEEEGGRRRRAHIPLPAAAGGRPAGGASQLERMASALIVQHGTRAATRAYVS